jgi:single-stranded-DNA-specific exonuclease
VKPGSTRDEAGRGILSDVLQPRHRWVFPVPVSLDPDVRAAIRERGLSERIAAILAARGVATAGELGAWFAAPQVSLHDPEALPDAGRIRERIAGARSRGERVMVFGDFDADGLTGLAILALAFRRLGLDVEPYVPSRLDEGHGLSLAAVEAAGANGTTLIVTVDCGSTSVAEIGAARDAGIDVIVTDHHRVPPELPPALAVVNPHRPDSRYPDRRLAGSGVAFKVAALLLADEPGGPAFARSLADLATIGTVADVAPVVGENRAIARLGLDLLRTAPRPGIAALLARASVPFAKVDLETVAFALAPRLNAAGRVGEAADAARLLVAEDPAEAAALAETLEAANASRRDLMRSALAEARAALGLPQAGSPAADGAAALATAGSPARLLPAGPAVADGAAGPAALPPAVVVRGAWPVGIVGLVAGRLAEELSRPAIVGADLGDIVRASCRGDGTLNLAAALEGCGDLLERHGGHAGAAGFEIAADRWEPFRERFLALAAALPAPDPRAPLRIDLALPAAGVDYALHRELAGLAPCGPGNPDPLVAILGLTVVRVRAAAGGHSQLTLRRERDVLDGIAFGRPDLAETVGEGDRLDVVGRLASRAFGGLESLQVEIRDAASSGWHREAAAIIGGTPAVAGTSAALAGSGTAVP